MGAFSRWALQEKQENSILGPMVDLDLLTLVFVPHVEGCLLIVRRESEESALLNVQLPEFLGDGGGGEGSLALAEVLRGRCTLGERAGEQVRGERGLWAHRVRI